MNYFRKQKNAQKDINNYYVPASVDTIQKLHSDASMLLLQLKYKQALIEATKNYIETTKMEKSKQEQLLTFKELVEEKQMLLNSYRKIMIEINKQNIL